MISCCKPSATAMKKFNETLNTLMLLALGMFALLLGSLSTVYWPPPVVPCEPHLDDDYCAAPVAYLLLVPLLGVFYLLPVVLWVLYEGRRGRPLPTGRLTGILLGFSLILPYLTATLVGLLAQHPLTSVAAACLQLIAAQLLTRWLASR